MNAKINQTLTELRKELEEARFPPGFSTPESEELGLRLREYEEQARRAIKPFLAGWNDAKKRLEKLRIETPYSFFDTLKATDRGSFG